MPPEPSLPGSPADPPLSLDSNPTAPPDQPEIRPILRIGAVLCQWMAGFFLAWLIGGGLELLFPRTGSYSRWSGGTNWYFWASFGMAILLKDALPGLYHLRRLFGHTLVPFPENELQAQPRGGLTPFSSMVRQIPWALPLAWIYLANPYRLWIDPTFGPAFRTTLVTNPAWETALEGLGLTLGIAIISQFFLSATGLTLSDRLGGTVARPLVPAPTWTPGWEAIWRSLVIFVLMAAAMQVPIPPFLARSWSDATMNAIGATEVLDGEVWWKSGLANWATWHRYRVSLPAPVCLSGILAREGGGVTQAEPLAAAGSPPPPPSENASGGVFLPTPVLHLTGGPTGWFGRLSCQIPVFIFKRVEQVFFDDRGAILSRQVSE